MIYALPFRPIPYLDSPGSESHVDEDRVQNNRNLPVAEGVHQRLTVEALVSFVLGMHRHALYSEKIYIGEGGGGAGGVLRGVDTSSTIVAKDGSYTRQTESKDRNEIKDR